jgi:tetratricopeptide (TPR) repeat protein
MVKELNRYQEAKTGLEGWLITNPSDEEAQALLVDCLIELGKEQIDARHPKSALDLLEQADKYRLRQPELRALISKAAVVQTTDILQEENTLYKKEGDSQDKQILRNAANLLEAAIQLLERVKKTYYVSDADFTAQLAEAYFRRGLIRHRLTENQGCLDDLERTLKINPNHAAANENYVTALMNRAFDHLNGNNPEKALELLKQAIDRDPVKVDRQQAGQILFGLGIKHANEAINAINYGIGWGRQPLINALAEIDQAIELDPGNQHYRTERAKVYQIMIQRPY